ncbi:MAG: ribonuclease III [Spirulina sp. DLM2.Bin59]|nr:MAG: ribonuclease III [Spirulina sp. DLM2.Bin59]
MTIYRERIDQDLMNLRDELYHLVTHQIEAEALNQLRRKNKLSQDQDICFLLRAIDECWDDFKAIIAQKHQEEAKFLLAQIRNIRNRHAHQYNFSLLDTYRALDDMQRFTNFLNLQIAKELAEQCTELLKQISQHLNQPQEHEASEIKKLKQTYSELLKKLPFNDVKQLDLALTHSSYLYENPHQIDDDNERLEFLGDTVIGLVVAHYFYENNPRYRESQLSQSKAKVENNLNLARFAQGLNLGQFIKVGNGENSETEKILADAFEAVIGAYFLDSGLAAVTKFMTPLIKSMGDLSIAVDPTQSVKNSAKNYKQKIADWAKIQQKTLPKYEVIQSGIAHKPMFMATVIVGDTWYGTAQANKKKQAEQQAAFDACKRLNLL